MRHQQEQAAPTATPRPKFQRWLNPQLSLERTHKAWLDLSTLSTLDHHNLATQPLPCATGRSLLTRNSPPSMDQQSPSPAQNHAPGHHPLPHREDQIRRNGPTFPKIRTRTCPSATSTECLKQQQITSSFGSPFEDDHSLWSLRYRCELTKLPPGARPTNKRTTCSSSGFGCESVRLFVLTAQSRHCCSVVCCQSRGTSGQSLPSAP